MTSIVYFFQVDLPPEFARIKIGTTSWDANRRVSALKFACPYDLKWIGAIPGGRAEERALHNKFAEHRVKGEWFNPHPSILEYIKEACPDFDPETFSFSPRADKIRERLVYRTRRVHSDRDLLLEVSGINWFDWQYGRSYPTDEQLDRLEKHLDYLDEVRPLPANVEWPRDVVRPSAERSAA